MFVNILKGFMIVRHKRINNEAPQNDLLENPLNNYSKVFRTQNLVLWHITLIIKEYNILGPLKKVGFNHSRFNGIKIL